jgi:PAS domain-containing protein
MTQGILVIDARGAVQEANPSACRILKMDPVQAINIGNLGSFSFVNVRSEQISPEALPWMTAIHTGKNAREILGVRKKSGKIFSWILAFATPNFREGEASAYQVTLSFVEISDLVRSLRV